eukprot:4854624-Alexandrium_andersonii.AAC.1
MVRALQQPRCQDKHHTRGLRHELHGIMWSVMTQTTAPSTMTIWTHGPRWRSAPPTIGRRIAHKKNESGRRHRRQSSPLSHNRSGHW